MPNYRRPRVTGGTYFITQVTYRRHAWLCGDIAREALRSAIINVRQNRPFRLDAFVLLPDHFHCLMTLPSDDSDISTRIRLIKTYVTRHYGAELEVHGLSSSSRMKRKERTLWQRRFWDHVIRDEQDLIQHCHYIHYNPVRHSLCQRPTDWPFSSVHRFVDEGRCSQDWAEMDVELDGTVYDV